MKLPISVSNKKYIGKMNTKKSNKEASEMLPCKEVEPYVIKVPNAVLCHQENGPSTPINTEDISSNLNANVPTHNYPWLTLPNNSELLENLDVDGRLFGMFKRISFDRSISWEDSGFNSCTSDDRDDLSVSDRSSFDSSFFGDDEDEHAAATKQISLRFRQRSYSLDSESSDLSDSHLYNFQNSKSSSSTTYSDLDKNLVLWRNSNGRLFNNEKISRRKKLVNSNNTSSSSSRSSKLCLVGTDTDTSDISVVPPRPAFPRRRRVGKDHNNNNTQNASIIKNLTSYQKHSSPRLNNCFQERGLLTLISCIFYMLILGFAIGVCGFLYQVIKLFMSKEDLQDLRKSVAKSRQNEKLSSLDKARNV